MTQTKRFTVRDYDTKDIEIDRERLIRQVELVRMKVNDPYATANTEFIIGNTRFIVHFPDDLQSQ